MTPARQLPPEWWDDFWEEHQAATLAEHADHWHDVVWRYLLGRRYELFEGRAPGRRMLECGCGSARVSQFLAERGYECTLVDYSEGALAVAQQRFASRGLKARYVRADIMRLPFSDGSFDIVYSGGVLQFFSDIQRPVHEMARTLDRGGLFVADVVPEKFSIQTLADVERTLVHSLRHLAKGQFRAALRRTQHLPPEYGVQPWLLADYLCACDQAGLTDTQGRVTSPFPSLALPKLAQRYYARAMQALTRQWRGFDESTAAWTEIVGTTYRISASKPPAGARSK